jgi:predicted amidohydrolase
MASTLGVAVAQFAPGPDRSVNVATMTALATSAAERGAGLVVFPEYSSYFTPEMGPDWIAAAEPIDGPFATEVAEIAKVLGITVVAGLLEVADVADSAHKDRAHNTVIAVAPTGERIATYRKIHLYDAFGARESDWIAPGPVDGLPTFGWGEFTVGLQTCYDIRFPEVTRSLVDRGAELIVVPAEWVRGPLKEHHWRTLLTARAIENTVYLAAADHPPPIGAGNSMVLDPMGVELATIGETEDVALAFPTRARLDAVRAANPALQLRRFSVTAGVDATADTQDS